MKRADPRTAPQLKLRLPSGLKERIEACAEAAMRPLSSEIIRRLEWSFRAEEQGHIMDDEADASSIEQRLHDAEMQIELLIGMIHSLSKRLTKLDGIKE
ncbi:Arc family DNA-binding protein [Mesorhizobium sp. B3-1-7]|uniref:Arc family DNA-binding protein n=1 Tax=Mesorhizobium sp. B3-1-7 TaxID=2589894 RepID=UPI0011274178|nr:Arc family DNA-binding protein [Mesorhizobium sp. B3-1-7]TPI58657.1 Arc family DNA-binding protein [Mesorhizobium sp. B3-1-7]